MMKKCVLVNCFASSNEMRVEPIREQFEMRGYKTVYFGADYHHAKKTYVDLNEEITPIHVKAYKKNLSLQRLCSHYDFSRQIYRQLEKEKPDVIYVKFPPNSLVKEVYRYKKNNSCKVILDVFDLWPESLPMSKTLKRILMPITSIWACLRNSYLKYADYVFTECDMYQNELKKYLPEKVSTLYLTKNDIEYCVTNSKDEKAVHLCYLGGINNLIDLDNVGVVIKTLSRTNRVTFDIIGDGVNKDALISVAKETGAVVQYHGIVYDEEEKYRIMSQCDFGLNLMKNTVKVALSLKSIEYFRAGVALINSIPEDTWKIVEKHEAGLNVNESFGTLCERLNTESIIQWKKNARTVYETYFSKERFNEEFSAAVGSLLD